MTTQKFDAPPPNGSDADRLVSEYRERIIELEAHGLPGEGSALWDVLDDILADIKRRQPPANPDDASRG